MFDGVLYREVWDEMVQDGVVWFASIVLAWHLFCLFNSWHSLLIVRSRECVFKRSYAPFTFSWYCHHFHLSRRKLWFATLQWPNYKVLQTESHRYCDFSNLLFCSKERKWNLQDSGCTQTWDQVVFSDRRSSWTTGLPSPPAQNNHFLFPQHLF